jgi:hypothetical protein
MGGKKEVRKSVKRKGDRPSQSGPEAAAAEATQVPTIHHASTSATTRRGGCSPRQSRPNQDRDRGCPDERLTQLFPLKRRGVEGPRVAAKVIEKRDD